MIAMSLPGSGPANALLTPSGVALAPLLSRLAAPGPWSAQDYTDLDSGVETELRAAIGSGDSAVQEQAYVTLAAAVTAIGAAEPRGDLSRQEARAVAGTYAKWFGLVDDLEKAAVDGLLLDGFEATCQALVDAPPLADVQAENWRWRDLLAQLAGIEIDEYMPNPGNLSSPALAVMTAGVQRRVPMVLAGQIMRLEHEHPSGDYQEQHFESELSTWLGVVAQLPPVQTDWLVKWCPTFSGSGVELINACADMERSGMIVDVTEDLQYGRVVRTRVRQPEPADPYLAP